MGRTVRAGLVRVALAAVGASAGGVLLALAAQTPDPAETPAYCRLETRGTQVELVRPAPGDPPIDDVNWFARPVPNPAGHWIVGFASHDENYLYDLTTGARIRIPDRSDAVATPDGRYITVPSHYTPDGTVNFYDLPALLAKLRAGEDASDVAPVFAHVDPDVADAYYQSVGVVSHDVQAETERTVYRMMFSGSNVEPAPGFRIVDYEFVTSGGVPTVTPTRAMRLCPQIVEDMATPFISKDGRYIAAHDNSRPDTPPSLKIFAITATDPASQATSCDERVDFRFAAGKADFSYDGTALTFHISKFNYLTPFVNGGLVSPTITDVVVVNLDVDAAGEIEGYTSLARVTTSTTEGVGSYFPAFLPDGKLFYISNTVPKNSDAPPRFHFTVVDPERERTFANFFADDRRRAVAETIGELWRRTCAPALEPFQPNEAPWVLMSLPADQCRALVEAHGDDSEPAKADLTAACGGAWSSE